MEKDIIKAFEQVDNLEKTYLEYLKEICLINSKSEDKQDVDRVLETILEREKSKEYRVVRKAMENAGDVASLTLLNGEELPTICLSAHMDTVFPKGTFSDPMVTEDEEKMYGPGVADDKGGVVLGFLIMEALKNIGFKKANVKMILQSDEEVGSVISDKKTLDFMCDEAKGSLAFFNLESSMTNSLTLSRYGILNAYFEIIGKAAHAATKLSGKSVSAIKEAAEKIVEIEDYNGGKNLSFVVGKIQGGSANNVISENCKFTVDCRVKTKEDMEKAKEFLLRVANKQYVEGTICKVEFTVNHMPFEENEKTNWLFDFMNDVSKKYFNEEYIRTEISGGGADSAYPSAAGIPTICSAGFIGGKLHTTQEYMVKSSMAKTAKALIATIFELANNN